MSLKASWRQRRDQVERSIWSAAARGVRAEDETGKRVPFKTLMMRPELLREKKGGNAIWEPNVVSLVAAMKSGWTLEHEDIPPVIAIGDEQGAEIIDGHHRVEAARRLGVEVPVILLSPSVVTDSTTQSDATFSAFDQFEDEHRKKKGASVRAAWRARIAVKPMKNLGPAMDRAQNVFGPLKPDIRRRIVSFMTAPSADTWDDISSIIITQGMGTLWQAMIAHDPDFPRQGRATDAAGNVVREWAKIPSPDQVLAAIERATQPQVAETQTMCPICGEPDTEDGCPNCAASDDLSAGAMSGRWRTRRAGEHDHHLESVKKAILEILRQGPRTMAGVQDVLYTRGVDFQLSHKAMSELMAENLINKNDTAHIRLAPTMESDARQFDHLVGQLIFAIKRDLAQNGPTAPDKLFADMMAPWSGIDHKFFTGAWEKALEALEKKNEVEFSDAENVWKIPGTGRDVPETPSDVLGMKPAERQKKIDALLDRWNQEPEKRPQIEEQLRSLRAARALWSLRLAVRNADGLRVSARPIAPAESGPRAAIAPSGNVYDCYMDHANWFRKHLGSEEYPTGWVRFNAVADLCLSFEQPPTPQQWSSMSKLLLVADGSREFFVEDGSGSVKMDRTATVDEFRRSGQPLQKFCASVKYADLSKQADAVDPEQQALIDRVLGQINEDEIAASGIAAKVTDFVWSLTRINPRDTNFGKDPIADTKQWLDEESAEYLEDMGEPRLRGGERAQRREIERNPVVVIRGDDGVLWVLDGNHRTAQAMVLGLESMPALVGVKKTGVGKTPISPDYHMGSKKNQGGARQSLLSTWARRADAEKRREPDPKKVKRNPLDVLAQAGFSNPQMLVNDIWTAFTRSGAREHRDHQITSIHLTGSRWYGKEQEGSDLDVVVFHSGQNLMSEANGIFREMVHQITGGVVDAFLLPETESWDHPMSGNIMTLTSASSTPAWLRLSNDPLKKIIEINGVKIGIEWPKGSTRTWKHLPGNDYEKLMKADYGYIRGTEGEDGEEIDVYAGPDRDSDLAFVVTQLDKKTGEYDEDKIMLGYSSKDEAEASYLHHMEKAHFGGIKALSWDKFLAMVPKKQRVEKKEDPEKNQGEERQSLLSAWTKRASTNTDRDQKLFDFQDSTIEPLPKLLQNIEESNQLGIRLENAGDIFRELVWRDYPDPGYIGEKVEKIRRHLTNPQMTQEMPSEAMALMAQIISLFQSIDTTGKSPLLLAAIDLSVALAQQDMGRAATALPVFDQVGQQRVAAKSQNLFAAWVDRQATPHQDPNEVSIGDITYRSSTYPVVVQQKDLDRWLQLRVDDRIIHDKALGSEFTALVSRMYEYAAVRIEPNANIRESQNISLYPDIERCLEYYGYGKDEAKHEIEQPDSQEKLKQAAFDMFEHYRIDQMGPAQAADLLMNMAVVLHKDWGMSVDDAKMALSSFLIEWGGGGPENLHLNNLDHGLRRCASEEPDNRSDLQKMADQIHDFIKANPQAERNDIIAHVEGLWNYKREGTYDFGLENQVLSALGYLIEDEKRAKWTDRGWRTMDEPLMTVEEHLRGVDVAPGSQPVDHVMDGIRAVDVDGEKDRLLDQFSKGEITQVDLDKKLRRLQASAAEEPEDEPELSMEQKVQALLYEIARDSEKAGWIPDYDDVLREVTNFMADEAGVDAEQLDQESIKATLKKLEMPGWMSSDRALGPGEGFENDKDRKNINTGDLNPIQDLPKHLEEEGSLRARWRRRAGGEQKLLRELVCTVIGSDTGTTNDAVLPKGTVVGVQPWSNDHTIFFYSPFYSQMLVRGKVMRGNQYAASVEDFRAATDIGYGEGTGYAHGPECFCEECMANDDMSTRRCPSCGSRECPGDGHSIDCRKPGTMTVKDIPVETRDSLLDKFNRGEIDEKTLRRRMKQISSLLSRWHRRASVGEVITTTDELRGWEGVSEPGQPSPKSHIIPVGTRLRITRKIRLKHGGSPMLAEVEVLSRAKIPKKLVIRLGDIQYSGDVVSPVPKQSVPSTPQMMENHIIDLLRQGPTTISRDLHELLEGKTVSIDEKGDVSDFDQPFADMVSDAIGRLLDRGTIMFDGSTAEFSLLKEPEPTAPEHVPGMSDADRSQKVDALLDQLSQEKDPARKKQIEQRLRSLQASVRRAGDVNDIAEHRSPGAIKDCGHHWSGKKEGQRGWCGRCGL